MLYHEAWSERNRQRDRETWLKEEEKILKRLRKSNSLSINLYELWNKDFEWKKKKKEKKNSKKCLDY